MEANTRLIESGYQWAVNEALREGITAEQREFWRGMATGLANWTGVIANDRFEADSQRMRFALTGR